VRSFIDNVYAGYASGHDLFPSKRIRIGFEDLPQKTQRVAALLEHAWAVIDEDRSYFNNAVLGTFDTLKASGSKDDKKALVVTRIGRNVVNLAIINVLPEPAVSISQWPRGEFVEQFEGHQFGLHSGGSVTLRDGKMQGSFNGLVVRHSNAAGVFGISPEQTAALMTAVGTTPIQTFASL